MHGQFYGMLIRCCPFSVKVFISVKVLTSTMAAVRLTQVH